MQAVYFVSRTGIKTTGEFSKLNGRLEGESMSSLKAMIRPTIAVSAFLSIFVIAPGVASGAAAADPCGLITQFETARAFDSKHAAKSSVVVRAPGNTAGVVRVRCRVLIWNGHRPGNGKQQRIKLLDGELATLRIESWVADESPHSGTWLSNFGPKVKGLTSRARAQFTESGMDGFAVAFPKNGAAHSLGFAARPGQLNKARAFWWDRSSGAIISISAVQAQGKPTLASVRAFAAIAVRQFFASAA